MYSIHTKKSISRKVFKCHRVTLLCIPTRRKGPPRVLNFDVWDSKVDFHFFSRNLHTVVYGMVIALNLGETHKCRFAYQSFVASETSFTLSLYCWIWLDTILSENCLRMDEIFTIKWYFKDTIFPPAIFCGIAKASFSLLTIWNTKLRSRWQFLCKRANLITHKWLDWTKPM